MWYRVQASLAGEPRLENDPFDAQRLRIAMEDTTHGVGELSYAPLARVAGVDRDVRVPGWSVGAHALRVEVREYPFGESVSRLEFDVEIAHALTSTALKSFPPPAAFMLVSALSFLLHPSKVAQRLTLGTSVIISAVAFHISQTVSLPPLGDLIPFDRVMIRAYSFLAASLEATVLTAMDEDYWKTRDPTRDIHRWGALAAVVVPFLTFAALSLA